MSQEDYPLTLNAQQMMEILRCGREKLYEYARRRDFPRLQGHRHIKAPRDAFFRWFNETAVAKEAM